MIYKGLLKMLLARVELNMIGKIKMINPQKISKGVYYKSSFMILYEKVNMI